MSDDYTRKIAFEQEGIVLAEKERGETLAVFLDRFRKERDIAPDVKITYAGRLDPIASGQMLLLVGDARFQKEEYLGLSKTYQTGIVFGLTTDTLDPLGIITQEGIVPELAVVQKIFDALPTDLRLPYPKYSSRPVNGKPLFMHARAGEEVVVPLHTAKIFKKEFLKSELVSIESLAIDAIQTIQKVAGDFRQTEIIESWEKFLIENSGKKLLRCTFSFTVSGGAYIRALAQYLGKQAGSVAYAHTIQRISFEK